MSEINSIEKALLRAKAFLAEAGVPTTFCILMETPKLESGKWTVKFENTLSGEIYTVTMDILGNIIGYDRKKQRGIVEEV